MWRWITGVFVWGVRLFSAPVRPGSALSVKGKEDPSFGTLGCVVSRNGERYVLTCAHVLQGGKSGDGVHLYDLARRRLRRCIGMIRHLPRETASALDCALVSILWPARVHASFPYAAGRVSREPFPLSELRIVNRSRIDGRIDVQAFGANSGHIKGGASVEVYSVLEGRPRTKRKGHRAVSQIAWVTGPPFIAIKPTHEPNRFCQYGDSGALVLTMGSEAEPSRPLGLLVSTDIARDDQQFGLFGYAIPIQRVLQELGSSARIEID